MAKIEVGTQGVNGGKTKHEYKGYVELHTDIKGNNFCVILDGYEGQGKSYKPRNEAKIQFNFPNGKSMEFETIEEFYMALTGCRQDETGFPPF
jgi:hypothetical protein